MGFSEATIRVCRRCATTLGSVNIWQHRFTHSVSTSDEQYLSNLIRTIIPKNASQADQAFEPNISTVQVQPRTNQTRTRQLKIRRSTNVSLPKPSGQKSEAFVSSDPKSVAFLTNLPAMLDHAYCDEPITPVSSIVHPNQSLDESVFLARRWFERLDLKSIRPSMPTSGNLAPYVHKSYTLTQLVRMGCDLSRLESKPGVANMLVKMDFHKTVEPIIWQLNSYGFTLEQVATIFTACPKLLTLEAVEINSRISYFLEHAFQPSCVVKMLAQCPYILQLSSIEVDRQLGSIQKLFGLTADALRSCVTSAPKAIVQPLEKIKDVYVVLIKMLGFSTFETRDLVQRNSKILIAERDRLAVNFMFMNSSLDLPQSSITRWPRALTAAPHLLSQRATYLVKQGFFQPDPTRPLYTPLCEMVEGTDAEFVERFAHTDETQYDNFLKTL